MEVHYIKPEVMTLALVDATNQLRGINPERISNLVATAGQPSPAEPRHSVLLMSGNPLVVQAVIYFKDRDNRDDQVPDYEVKIVDWSTGSPHELD